MESNYLCTDALDRSGQTRRQSYQRWVNSEVHCAVNSLGVGSGVVGNFLGGDVGGGNWRIQRKPTWTWEEHANYTHFCRTLVRCSQQTTHPIFKGTYCTPGQSNPLPMQALLIFIEPDRILGLYWMWHVNTPKITRADKSISDCSLWSTG